jgi:hypothetical protein
MVRMQETKTNRLEKVMNIARLPTLSIRSPRKGERPADIKKGKLYKELAVILGTSNSFMSMFEVN